MPKTRPKTCPECGHDFQGNGWDGIDAHWKAQHAQIMPYAEAWPLIESGQYVRLAKRRRREDFSQAAARTLRQATQD